MTHVKALEHNRHGASPTGCPGRLEVLDIVEDGADLLVLYYCRQCAARVPILYAAVAGEDGQVNYRWAGETRNSYYVPPLKPDRLVEELAASFRLDFSRDGDGRAEETD